MSTIRLDFKHLRGNQWLIAEANLCEGWRRLKNGYGFFAKANTEYQGDDDLKIQVWVNPSPRRLAPVVSAFPIGLQGSGPGQMLLHGLQDGILKLATTMDIIKSGRLKSGTPGLYEDQIEIAREGRVAYLLRFSATYTTKGAPPPVTREYDTLPFLSGGLPELGKRR